MKASLRSLRTAIVACCIVAMGLSACADDPSPSTSTDSAPDETSGATFAPSEKPTGTPIKIGVLYDGTGATAQAGEMAGPVAKAWGDWINETQGGVNGHPVEILLADTQSQPATAVSEARRLVAEGAAVIASSSAVANGTEPYLDSEGIPEISLDDGGRPVDPIPSWFSVDMGYPNEAEAAAALAKIAGKKSILAVVCAEYPACTGIGDILEGYAPTVGLDYGGTVQLAADAPSSTAQCLQIVESGAEIVATFTTPAPAAKLAETCIAQGFKGQFIIYSTIDESFKAMPDSTYGVSIDFPWYSDAAPVVQYRDVMAQFGPDVNYKAYKATNMWALLQLFDKALTASGPAADVAVTGADVITSYQTSVKDETLDGLLPQPITYAAEGNTEITCFWPIQHTGGGNYETLAPVGDSGNGASGDLASSCLE